MGVEDVNRGLPNPSPAEQASPSVEAIGRSALRKASRRLLPLIALGYGAAYMDRVNISFASLRMNHDLHFSASIYGFGAGLFFLSYAACELPSNLLLLRVGARRWIARIMFTWGILAMAMMFVRTPLHFYIVRFLLGMAEAGFAPGVIYYLMQWFPPELRAHAISRFYVAVPLTSALMGVVAGALLNLNGRLGLKGWQWLFLVEGLPPIVISALFLRYLPNTPHDARWLTADERQWLIARIAADSETAPGVHTGGIAPVLKEPRVWLLGLFFCCIMTSAYGYSFSAPTIIQHLTGLSIARVGFIVAGMGLLSTLSLLLNSVHSDRAGERYLHVVFPCLLMTAGYLVGGLTVDPLIAIPAFAVCVMSFYATQGPAFSIPAEFLKGRSAAAGYAAVNTLAILGGFIGPYWIGVARDLTGDNQRGILTLAIPTFAAAGLMLILRRTGIARRKLRLVPLPAVSDS